MSVPANSLAVARRYMGEHGWPAMQAAAMVGNQIQESLLIPAIVGDKGLPDQAHGLSQWRGDRFRELQAFAQTKGRDWTDINVQIDFVPFEMTTTEKATAKRFVAAKTLEEFCQAAIGYHRPGGWTAENPEAGNGWKNRLRYSAEVLDLVAPAPTAIKPVTEGAAPPMSLEQMVRNTTRGWLEVGDQGAVVTAAQKAMAALGYPLKGTGYYGSATAAAVKDVQTREGITVDGELGPVTAKKIDARAGKPYPAVTATRPLWVTNGLNELGIHEVAGKGSNPTIMRWAKDEGGYIAKVFTDDDIAWCSLYANHLLTAVGLRGTEDLWALNWDSDKNWPNVKISGPAVGAFAPMKRDGGGHIGVIVGRFANGTLALLAGNQGNAVTVAQIPQSRPLSYRWPIGPALPKLVGFSNLPVVGATGLPAASEA